MEYGFGFGGLMNRTRIVFFMGVLIGVASLAGGKSAIAQPASASVGGCTTGDFQAAHLEGKEMKFNVIVPADYARDTERRFPVLYLLHGFSGDYTDWCKDTRLVDYAKPYEEIIIMPEGDNSWYVNSYSEPKMQWEDYIIDDLVGYVDAHYRTKASRTGRAIAGLSMGGYGALFLGLKHHDMFAAVASLSGVVAAANLERWDVQTQNHINNSRSQFYEDVRRTLAADFGPESSPARKDEDPFSLIRMLTPANCPQLYLAIGWGDSLLGENREFVALLSELKMPYRYAEVPGQHEWKVWEEQVQRVLAVEAPVIGAERTDSN
jgi:putative tributyrin esterase